MRTKYAVAALFVPIAATISFSVIGQEEPLPAVQSRAVISMNGGDTGFALVEPTVALVVEPFHSPAPLTLADAARANDFTTFDMLYRDAERHGQNVSAFRALHDLWSWSQGDPLGAFYGSETHDRLATAFPGYARYIDDYRIVDQRGNIFYPTSETRTFLLDRALEGQSPRVMIAENQAPRPEERTTTTTPRQSTRPTAHRSTAPSHRPRTTRTSTTTPATARPEQTAVATAAPVTAPVTAPVNAPVNAPVATPALAPPAPVSAVPVPAPSVAVAAPVESQPAPAIAEQQGIEETPARVPAQVPSPFRSRGILLLVIGLVGVGLLALMLRAPKEMPTSIINAAPPEKPAAPVQPIRPANGEQPKKPHANAS